MTPAILACIHHEHGLHHLAVEALRIGQPEQPQDDALDRLRVYEAVREEQRAEDDAERRGVCCG